MVLMGKDKIGLIGENCMVDDQFEELLTTNIPNILTHQIDVVAGLAPAQFEQGQLMKTMGITTFAFCFMKDTKKDGFVVWNDHAPTSMFKSIPVIGKGNYWGVKMT